MASAPLDAAVIAPERHGIRATRWATKNDWDRHQEDIRRLYLSEKRELTEVMAIVEAQYGFKATLVFPSVPSSLISDFTQAQYVQKANSPMGSG